MFRLLPNRMQRTVKPYKQKQNSTNKHKGMRDKNEIAKRNKR